MSLVLEPGRLVASASTEVWAFKTSTYRTPSGNEFAKLLPCTVPGIRFRSRTIITSLSSEHGHYHWSTECRRNCYKRIVRRLKTSYAEFTLNGGMGYKKPESKGNEG